MLKVVIFIVSLLLTACGDTGRLSLLSTDATLLAFGDSLTSGVGVPVQQSYPAVLAQLLDLKVINAGKAGEVTADGKDRLEALLKANAPDLVLICHGGNDFLHRLPLAETEKNLREMVSQAQSLGIEVVLIGVPEPGIWGKAPDLYRRVAREFNVPLDDEMLGKLETDSSMKSDPVHLNKQGYRKLAEQVAALLARSGAVALVSGVAADN